MKRTRLRRKVGLSRKTPLRARRRVREKLSELWYRDLGPCALSGNVFLFGLCDGRVHAHHIIERQALKRHGHADRLSDPRNRLSLCEKHHHTQTRLRSYVPRWKLPPEAFEFAEEVGLLWLLELRYQ